MKLYEQYKGGINLIKSSNVADQKMILKKETLL